MERLVAGGHAHKTVLGARTCELRGPSNGRTSGATPEAQSASGERMIAHDQAGDKRLLRVALAALARASPRAVTVVAVAAFAVTLALAESVAAFETVAVIGGSGGGAGRLGVATDGLALAESVAAFEAVAVIRGEGGGA